MSIKIKETSTVRPAQATPCQRMWISNLDIIIGMFYVPTVYFFQKPNGAMNYFDSEILKEALSRALVPFYPIAGRLARDKDGRMEIDCNSEGVLFVVAESDSVVEDFGDFAPTRDLEQLTFLAESGEDNVSACPLLVLQVTHFRCGGVSLGVRMLHTIADGLSGTHFINSWARIARGLDITISPFNDRTLLRARHPPTPSFPHIEFQTPPSMKTTAATTVIGPTVSIFKLTQPQLTQLKSRLNDTYSSYVTIAAHIWRCICIARDLPSDQLTKMHCATSGRNRLQPPLPDGYFGNVIFQATPMAIAGELTKDHTSAVAAEKIKSALTRMDDEYLRSTLDYLKLQKDLGKCCRGPSNFNSPNIGVTSWTHLPIHDADFGWGKPVFMGPGKIFYEGMSFVLPSANGDGSVSVAISLLDEHKVRFQKLFYDF